MRATASNVHEFPPDSNFGGGAATALEFFEVLYGTDAPGVLNLFTLPGERSHWFRAGFLAAAADEAAKLARTRNVYFGIGLQMTQPRGNSRGEGKGVTAIPALWMDIDVKHPVHRGEKALPPSMEAARSILAAFPLAPSIVVDTGHGLQPYWLFRELWVFDSDRERKAAADLSLRFQRTLQGIAHQSGWSLDTTADLARIFRVPGTINHKDPDHPKPVRILELHPERQYNPDDFEPYLTACEARGGDVFRPHAESEVASSQQIPRDKAEQIRSALEFVSSDEREVWLRMGMALHSTGAGVQAFELWTEWSQKSEKYDPVDQRRVWSSFKPSGGVTLASLFAEAIGNGWSNPSRGRAIVREDGAGWAEPQPLPTRLPEVEEFPELVLPSTLRPWLLDIAERIQCPLDFPAVACTTALASLIGRKVGIRPKQYDDWTVVPNLWSVIVGRPGVLKTPAVQEAIKPIKRLEVEKANLHKEELTLWKACQTVRDISGKLEKKNIEKQLRAGADPMAIAAQLVEAEDPEPARKRYIVNDTTVEKLGEILAANPNGVLLFRDEIAGFLRGLERKDRGSDRAFYLEAWSGDKPFTYDRIGRGTLDIETACVSILGCIQPGLLRDYLRSAAEGGGGDDGLMQRFQLAVWPNVSKEWKDVDRWPDGEARQRAFDLVSRLDTLTAEAIGAERDTFDGARGIPFLRFNDDAQEAFSAWREELERRVRSGDLHPALESHLAKYRSLVPSLALVYHLADGQEGPVSRAALLTAIAWSHYLESHTRRLYATVVGTDTLPAKELARRIQEGDITDGFTLRDVYRNHWTGLSKKEDAQQAAEVLEDLAWIRSEWEDTGGRPREVYRINPRLDIGR